MADFADSISGNISNLPDTYIVGLWSYCNVKNYENGATVTQCSTPSLMFRFDFTSALGLPSSWVERVFPNPAHVLLDAYQKISRYMGIVYIAIISTTVITVVVGSIAKLYRRSVISGLCTTVNLHPQALNSSDSVWRRSKLSWLLFSR